MGSHLNAEQLRRLDGLNLIRAWVREDADGCAEILQLYPDRTAVVELLARLADIAGQLLTEELLIMYRNFLLGAVE
jgi:hypothetical protein